MIIIEGPDGSGKSTLKNSLLELMDLEDVSLTKEAPIIERQRMAMISPAESVGLITDRSYFISEVVYSKLLRGFNTPETIWAPLYRKLYWGHLVIICTGHGQDTRKAYDNDEEVWKKTQETKAEAFTMYKRIAEVLKAETYNFQEEDTSRIIQVIQNYLYFWSKA